MNYVYDVGVCVWVVAYVYSVGVGVVCVCAGLCVNRCVPLPLYRVFYMESSRHVMNEY